VAADLEDEKVYVLAEKEMREKIRIAEEKQAVALKDTAESKRQKLLNELPEADKKFAKDIRGGLYRLSDSEILDDDFDVSDLLCWARGKRYERDIKEAVEKAVVEAQKDKKILGNQGGGTGGGSSSQASKGGEAPAKLSEEDKERALDMYDSLQISQEEKFSMYQKFLKKTAQKK
jgi:hypothetical protein